MGLSEKIAGEMKKDKEVQIIRTIVILIVIWEHISDRRQHQIRKRQEGNKKEVMENKKIKYDYNKVNDLNLIKRYISLPGLS